MYNRYSYFCAQNFVLICSQGFFAVNKTVFNLKIHVKSLNRFKEVKVKEIGIEFLVQMHLMRYLYFLG